MTKIVRTPTQATGGITADEAKAMKAHADLWITPEGWRRVAD